MDPLDPPGPSAPHAASALSPAKVPASPFAGIASAPTLALPKGGGAIRGIGEKFSANAVTGTGSLRVPLPTSPARGGFQPDLALAYDSGAGTGVFGAGWHVSVPQIGRKTDRGLPKYEDRDESDVYILSGMEDLVPVLGDDGKPAIFAEGDDQVLRYRPRVEGQFARIERREQPDGNVYWKAITAANTTSFYGRTAAAQIVDPAWKHRIFTWLLEETRDDRGNVIVYDYKAEDLDGVPGALSEQHRRSGSARFADRHLKRVRYGNTVPGDAASTVFAVVFDYGEHDALTPTPEEIPAQPWRARLDPTSSYRAGFEVRTYRLCQRVLMFHSFPELGPTPCLVASTDLGYDENSVLTKLTSIVQTGYTRDATGITYTRASMPPLQLGYSSTALHTEIQRFDVASLEGLPAGIDHRAQWVDLDGEGIAGVLVSNEGSLAYKRNLGDGLLAAPRTLPVQPRAADLRDSRQQLVDLDGDGRKELAFWHFPTSGFQERTDNDGWGRWTPFRLQPMFDIRSSAVHFMDVTGNGLNDLVLVDEVSLTLFPSLGRDGYGPPRRMSRGWNEDRCPPRSFVTDQVQAIVLADMTGDGLPDLVRIKNGSVCYWPNLGYGKFGAKVTMANTPPFDRPELFEPQRIRLGDIDGSATTDILYVHRDGIRLYANQAGNSLAAPIVLPRFPSSDDATTMALVDVFGSGTACLVWSSPHLRHAAEPMRYMDLHQGKKPHLLTSITNGMGLTTTMEYASSTQFYLTDVKAGAPWATKLPFPVQVLTRVESYDAVSRHRFVTTYAYHHGYFDGAEREFRGFGRVEQWDTESFSRFSGAGTLPIPANASDPELHLPPVRTKTWFHTGAWTVGARLSAHYAREYYQGDALATLLPDTIVPAGRALVAMREACRALKGQVLRQEIYAEDGTAQAAEPYTVSERSYQVRSIQAVAGRTHGVYLVHPREAVEYHYERNAAGTIDPRVTHAFTLVVDEYGVTTRSAAVAYPRRESFVAYPEPAAGAITLSEVDVVHVADHADWYRIGVPVETRSYQLVGLLPQADALLTLAQVFAAASAAVEVPYEQLAAPSEFAKRVLSQSRALYAKDDRTGPLPLGQVESLALPWQSYAKAFTPALLTSALGGRATDAILIEGGYVRFLPDDDAWWTPSGRTLFSGPGSFYLPETFVDAFGNTSTIVYDTYNLAVLQATDPLGNTVLADYEYRILSPVLVTDANGNRAAAQFDELGRVVATAIQGKVSDADGDTLADPTTTFAYNLTRFATTGEPNVVHSRAREQHGAGNTRWQEAYSYSDGSGHEVMRKIPAEPGAVPQKGADGKLVRKADGTPATVLANPRWVGTGRTIFDNKGNPVKQYEPFFSPTHEHEDEPDIVEQGVTPILRYDALGRLVRTDLPNGTFSKVELDAWKQTTFDPNDTVAESLWYQARNGLDPVTDPEGRAAALAYEHRGTPGVAHVDALGRTFLTIEDNGAAGVYATRLTLDLEGNPLVITDARQNEAMRHIFGMGGRALWQKSCDAGQRWMLTDVGGALLRAWDERGHTKRAMFDAVRRATHAYVQQGAAAEQLVGRTVYGEAHPSAATLNLRGKAYQVYDGAGVVTSGAYDFKGNLLHGTRRLATNYHSVPDWSALTGLTNVAAVAAVAEALLEAEVFTSATAYDALNRPISMTAPDSSEIRPTYNEAGLLEKVEARVRGAAAWTTFVDDIDYDAKGQREQIVYGNATTTTYSYDPETFRLVRLKTVRASDGVVLQNLAYAYDPVGNITEIKDSAQQTVFFDNAVVSPSTRYVYDALYRLIEASGREHTGGMADVQRDQNDVPLMNLPHANDAQALRNYIEQYVYDAVGNIVSMCHTAGVGSWTRWYQTAVASNRLLSTSALSGEGPAASYSAKYTYDEHGSMTSMPHLPAMGWDHNDQMHQVGLMGGGTAYYTYDAAGQRVRKVWEHSGLVEERIYLGGWELYRKRDSLGNLLLERETLHGMDGTRRVVLVETKTIDIDAGGAFAVVSRFRFQLDNHLGSASLEVDESGLVIGYEEYHPYGTTAYASGRSGVEVSGKRYRYTGKERDEETGLYYHGARHMAPWLGRWTSADPIGIDDSVNMFCLCRCNPVIFIDSDGMQSRIIYVNTRPNKNAVAWIPGMSKTMQVAHSEAELVTIAGGRPIFKYSPGASRSAAAAAALLVAEQAAANLADALNNGSGSGGKKGSGSSEKDDAGDLGSSAKIKGSGEKKDTSTGAAVAKALAIAGTIANLDVPHDEEGGSQYGIQGGLNSRATSSPEKQAFFGTLAAVVGVFDLKAIATAAAKAVTAKLEGKATKKLVEKAAHDAAENAAKAGAKKEAIEAAAKEAAEEAAAEGVKLTGGAKKVLRDPALQALKDASIPDAIRARGGKAGSWGQISTDLLEKPLGEVANMAAQGDSKAETAIKLVKQALSKAQNH